MKTVERNGTIRIDLKKESRHLTLVCRKDYKPNVRGIQQVYMENDAEVRNTIIENPPQDLEEFYVTTINEITVYQKRKEPTILVC